MYMNEASIPMNHYVLPLWSPPRIFYVNFLQSCAALGSLHPPSSHQQHAENRVTSEWATLGPFYQFLTWEFYKFACATILSAEVLFFGFFFPLYKTTAGKTRQRAWPRKRQVSEHASAGWDTAARFQKLSSHPHLRVRRSLHTSLSCHPAWDTVFEHEKQ